MLTKLMLLAGILASPMLAASPCGAYSDFAASTTASNLYNALNGKANVQCGTAAPTPLAGTAGVDFYVRLPAGSLFICAVTGNPCGNWVAITSSSGGGPTAAPATADFRVGCQSTVSGGNFDSAGGVGNPAVLSSCDPANGSMDGFASFPSGATYHVQGHTYLPSTFTDGVSAQIVDWNSGATSGAVTWQIAWQCVALNGIASVNGFGAYTAWAQSTALATASHRNETNKLTLTTGCAPDSLLYFDIQLTSANNTLAGAADARLKWLRLGVTE